MPKTFEKFIANLILLNKLRKAEREIGYKLVFKSIPDIWIDGIMRCDMTRTWKKFGLKISRGANYFTIGKIKEDVSTRFDLAEPQYQSWLGGYTIKLKQGRGWTLQDHLNLAVADQKSWLKRYGDPHPFCDFKEENCQFINDSIKLGNYSGTLYEGICTTHSDVGDGFANMWLKLSAIGMATVFNVLNPALNLIGKDLRPQSKGKSYEILKLKSYVAIFDIEKKDVKVVLYGNGIVENGGVKINTFEIIKNEILRAMNSCEVVKI